MTVQFDRIADVYDDTRRPLDAETLAGLRSMLDKRKCHSVLEIGVGTGRISAPLLDAGYEMKGLDISRKMMEKARDKGLPDLVLADAMKLPFKMRSLDAALMSHVFHLIDDPLAVMLGAAKVARVGVFALLRKRPSNWPWFTFYQGDDALTGRNDEVVTEAARKRFEERRERIRKIGAKYSWKWDPARHSRNWAREREIIETNPPDDLKVVSDHVVTETLEERISRFRKGAYSYTVDMPEAMREEIVKDMRADAASLPDWAKRPRHEVYQVAFWSSKTLGG